MTTITGVSVFDVRFPTSRALDGSDAMNPDPDYSAAYCVLRTDTDLEGHGFTFTIGRGNELCVEGIRSLAPLVVGTTIADFGREPVATWYRVTGDSQLRWLGPEKGVIHLAAGALINALWDVYAKSERKPLWKLLVDLEPEEFVRCVPFRHITDALTEAEALSLLHKQAPGKTARESDVRLAGYPAYTTSAGWLGYPDGKIRALCRAGLANGWTHFKIKVGRDLADDIRRLRIVREEIGDERTVMIDANQVWDVDQAITWMGELVQFKPLWIEEPTSPDDVLGHARIARALAPHGVGVATGEHCQNRVMFKQFLTSGGLQFCQVDACRLGGVNEVLAVLLLAAKYGVPVCPHAGGVGLCELVQHISIADYVCVSGSMEGRLIEYVNHLHEHFVDPVHVIDGRYRVPLSPGYSSTLRREVIEEFSFPNGPVWSGRRL